MAWACCRLLGHRGSGKHPLRGMRVDTGNKHDTEARRPNRAPQAAPATQGCAAAQAEWVAPCRSRLEARGAMRENCALQRPDQRTTRGSGADLSRLHRASISSRLLPAVSGTYSQTKRRRATQRHRGASRQTRDGMSRRVRNGGRSRGKTRIRGNWPPTAPPPPPQGPWRGCGWGKSRRAAPSTRGLTRTKNSPQRAALQQARGRLWSADRAWYPARSCLHPWRRHR